jgi:hypothetical protein
MARSGRRQPGSGGADRSSLDGLTAVRPARAQAVMAQLYFPRQRDPPFSGRLFALLRPFRFPLQRFWPPGHPRRLGDNT